MSNYERNRENAIGDLTTTAREFRLDVTHAEVRADEFGREHRVLVAKLDGAPSRVECMSNLDIGIAALRAFDVFIARGWDAVLRVDMIHTPIVHGVLAGAAGRM